MTTYNEKVMSGIDPDLEQAVRVIKYEYGHDISTHIQPKNLLKFGRNTGVGTNSAGYTLMGLLGSEQHETYVSTNIIDTISSSSADDSQQITIEGQTIDSDGNFTFVEQTATLNGQSKVTLTTPLARCTKLYNSNGTSLVGTIYAYQNQDITNGVPQTNNKVHCLIRAGKNRSEKASTTISNNDYWIATSFTTSVLQKTASFAEVEFQVREKNGVFKEVDIIGASAGANSVQQLKPYIIVPPNSDIRLSAIADGANTDIVGTIRGYLAKLN